ncbi:MAG: fumarylacetoacetate hydrolase family protein, partial [Anaerolineales bacterium]|nr:fumarylacetoacetate hydrolase family protein [Anaerolineales bacterium]
MQIVRWQPEEAGEPAWGWVDGGRIGRLEGSPFEAYRRKPATIALDGAHLLAPVRPGKIICVARNYPLHAAEHEAEVPAWPLLFFKPPTAVIGPGQAIRLPPQSRQVEHEAELAVVVGAPGRWISPQDAPRHVLGYCAANDVTARDLQNRDGQWTRGKGFDTFCPVGPWIETNLDPADALITCAVNGQMRQMGSTRDMVFSIPQLLAFISSVMTLEAGDLILTGTPAGVGPLQPGDEVVV